MEVSKRTLDRFWAKVNKTDKCWTWTASKSTGGYGHIQVNGKLRRASRFLWSVLYGEIPSGMIVCHTCDNPACVRPDHLFLGTHKDNAKDRDSKGRHKPPRGSAMKTSKLTIESVLEIRRAVRNKEMPRKLLAKKYGISEGHLCGLIKRRKWGWLEE